MIVAVCKGLYEFSTVKVITSGLLADPPPETRKDVFKQDFYSASCVLGGVRARY